MRSFSKFFLFISLAALLLNHANAALALEPQPRLIPDPGTYQAFLLGEWKPEAPTLIAIKDPFCPYCIRNLKRRAQLKKYNVFLFWAPILGEDSVTRVNEYFKCDSPVGGVVIEAAISRQAPRCTAKIGQKQLMLNRQMVDSYDPKSVPQYWLGGRRVSLANLNLFRPAVNADEIAKLSPLKVDWLRYRGLSLNEPMTMRHNMAIVLPDGYGLDPEVLSLLSNNTLYNWYLFSNNLNEPHKSWLWCQQRADSCVNKAEARDSGDVEERLSYYNLEFRLLTGLDQVSQPVFLLEGKVLSDREQVYLVPKEIRGSNSSNTTAYQSSICPALDLQYTL